MADISLTDFVDFVIKAGTPKLTKVSEIKKRDKYSPAFDFWKPLRDGIRNYHQSGSQNKSDLDALLQGISDKKKVNRYPEAIRAYKKFLGKKQISWFEPPVDLWSHAGLNVRVNPELGLEIDGIRYMIKLYFKEEAPSKERLGVILELMQLTVGSASGQLTEVAVLDVSKSKLTPGSLPRPTVQALLKGEAASFVQIWNSI